MNREEKLFPLELFNTRFNELEKSGYIENWVGKSVGFKDEIKKETPETDELKSFILDFRFFIQKNEPCSLRRLNKHFERLNISDEIKQDFKKQRNKFNKFLEAETNFGEKGNNPYTLGDIFYAYFYGKYSHSNNEKKRELVNKWQETSFIEATTMHFFFGTLYSLYFVLKKIKAINEQAIKEIKEN